MKIAFAFPGQGIQRKGMGRDLFFKYKDIMKCANDILGYSIEEICLNDTEGKLNDTIYSQPAIFIVNALSYYNKVKIHKYPDYLLGHSLGEYNALLAADVFDFESGLKLIKKRAELMSRQKVGAMAAIFGLDIEQIKKIISKNNVQNITISNINTFKQIVISGEEKQIITLRNIFLNNGAEEYIQLKVSGAFHSMYMKNASDEFNKAIDLMEFSKMSIPVVSNVTGRCYENDNIKEILKQHMCNPVQWVECVKFLLKNDVTEIYQIGNGSMITSTVRSIKNSIGKKEI